MWHVYECVVFTERNVIPMRVVRCCKHNLHREHMVLLCKEVVNLLDTKFSIAGVQCLGRKLKKKIILFCLEKKLTGASVQKWDFTFDTRPQLETEVRR